MKVLIFLTLLGVCIPMGTLSAQSNSDRHLRHLQKNRKHRSIKATPAHPDRMEEETKENSQELSTAHPIRSIKNKRRKRTHSNLKRVSSKELYQQHTQKRKVPIQSKYWYQSK